MTQLFIVYEKFTDWLRHNLELRGWSYSELARKAGITPGAVGNIMRGDRNPGHEVLERIAKALGLPIETVYRQAGLLPDITAREKVMEILAYRASLLDGRQLDELLKYADFIRERDTP